MDSEHGRELSSLITLTLSIPSMLGSGVSMLDNGQFIRQCVKKFIRQWGSACGSGGKRKGAPALRVRDPIIWAGLVAKGEGEDSGCTHQVICVVPAA